MVDNRQDQHTTPEEAPPTAPEEIHLPGPSYWPLVLAITITVAVAGLIVHPAVVAVGAIATFVAIVAWAGEGGH